MGDGTTEWLLTVGDRFLEISDVSDHVNVNVFLPGLNCQGQAALRIVPVDSTSSGRILQTPSAGGMSIRAARKGWSIFRRKGFGVVAGRVVIGVGRDLQSQGWA